MEQIDSNKKLKHFLQSELSKLLKDKDSSGAQPRCPHFGECGGCALQSLTYSQQLDLKRAALQKIFDGILPASSINITPAPSEYEYRLRMDYVATNHPIYAPHDRFGLRKKGNFSHVIDLQTCLLIPPGWFTKVRKVFSYSTSLGIPNYDLKTLKGQLRYLVVRVAQDRAMLNIVTKQTEPQIEDLAKFAVSQGFSSVNWLLQPADSDVSFGEVMQVWGDEYLQVTTSSLERNLKFNIGPNTFFQNNIQAFEQIVNYVQGFVPANALQNWELLDIYSGVGTLGISLAHMFNRVEGIEINRESVDLAKINASLNNVNNASYFVGDAAEFVISSGKQVGNSPQLSSFAIVDPPRTGLEPKGVAQILEIMPNILVYISCNPVTQRLDLEQGLLEHYSIIDSKGFDMFPQTLHMENVFVLERK